MINIETFHRTPVRGRSYTLFGKFSTEALFGITESFVRRQTHYLLLSSAALPYVDEYQPNCNVAPASRIIRIATLRLTCVAAFKVSKATGFQRYSTCRGTHTIPPFSCYRFQIELLAFIFFSRWRICIYQALPLVL